MLAGPDAAAHPRPDSIPQGHPDETLLKMAGNAARGRCRGRGACGAASGRSPLRADTQGSDRLLTLARTRRARFWSQARRKRMASPSNIRSGRIIGAAPTRLDRGPCTTGPGALPKRSVLPTRAVAGWAREWHASSTPTVHMRPHDGRAVANSAGAGRRAGGRLRRRLADAGFYYVGDLAEGLVRLLFVGPAPEGPVNLGSPKEIVVGAGAAGLRQPLPADDPTRRCP